MMRRFSQWMFFTLLVCALSFSALFFFQESAVEFADNLLEPWLDLCAVITPEQWQVQGNILLGLMWIFSGVIVYSTIIGIACVILLVFVGKLCNRIPGKNVTSEVAR